MTSRAINITENRGEAGMMEIAATSKEEILETIIDQYSQSILRMCYILLEDESLAQDAMQDCFIKAWKGLNHFNGNSSLKTWLMRIAINTCKDYKRSNWFKMVDHKQNLDELPEPSVMPIETDDTLIQAIQCLPRREKEALMLYYYQGLSMAEVAQALNVNSSTIHRRIRSAQKKLKTQLKEWYCYE